MYRRSRWTSLNFYVYAWPFIYWLYFIYARKFYVLSRGKMRRQWKSTLRVVLVRSHVTGPKGILVNQHGSSETAVNQFHASRCNAQSRLTRLIWARSRITLIILVPSRVTENPFATLWIEFGSWVLIWVVNPIQSIPIQILTISILNTTWKQQNNIEAESTCLLENGDFFSFSKKSTSTRCVFESFLPVHTKTRSWLKTVPSLMGACAFTGILQPGVISLSSIYTSAAKRRLQKSPLWRELLKRCFFDSFQGVIVDSRPNHG